MMPAAAWMLPGQAADERPALAPTPKRVVYREASAALYEFARPAGTPSGATVPLLDVPLLIVPSMINRWYVVDLRPGASLVEGLVSRGVHTYCLDWGVPEDEDRYLTWDDVIARLGRAVRRTLRDSGADRIAVLGYCMGATVAGIYTALAPRNVAGFVNLLGPFDFSVAGSLANAVNPKWFDVDSMVEAGNISPTQMQSGFVALRPTQQLAKWVSYIDRAHDPAARQAFAALEAWASDNVPFPAAAYRTYIRELYQQNALVAGTHRVGGRTVDLAAIRCPVLSIVAERDEICPPKAATALQDWSGSTDKTVLAVPGGHVGAVIGSRAARELYPGIAHWLFDRFGSLV